MTTLLITYCSITNVICTSITAVLIMCPCNASPIGATRLHSISDAAWCCEAQGSVVYWAVSKEACFLCTEEANTDLQPSQLVRSSPSWTGLLKYAAATYRSATAKLFWWLGADWTAAGAADATKQKLETHLLIWKGRSSAHKARTCFR